MSFDAARFAALSKKFGLPPATPKAVSLAAIVPSSFPPTPAPLPAPTPVCAAAASPTSSPEKSSPVAPKRLGRSRVGGDTTSTKKAGRGVDGKENPPTAALGVEEKEEERAKPERLGAFQRSLLKLPRARLEEREEEEAEEGEEDGAYSVSLTALKGSMRKMARAPAQQLEVEEAEDEEAVVEREREEGGDYDYNDGWLVEDDIVDYEDGEEEEEEEEEEGEEEEEDEEEGDSSEEDEEELHDGDHHVGCGGNCTASTTTTTTTAIASDGGFELPTTFYPSLPPPSATPSFRVTVLPTPTKSKAPPPLEEKKKGVSLQGIKDGAPHPRTGLVFIREEEGLPGDGGANKASLSSSSSSSSTATSRHTFRNKAARDALTSSLYAEYNTRVFGGRLPPMLTPPPPGAPPAALKAYTDKFEGGVGIPVEWRGRLIKTAGLTFMSTRRGGGGGGGGPACAARIALSTKVLDTPLKLAQTLLHEMCHAAQWVLDKVQRPPHGAAFQRWARAGTAAYPKRPVTVCHSYKIETKYQYQCGNGACGVVVGRHSKSIVSGKDGCKACGRGVMYEMGGGGGGGGAKCVPASTSKYREFMERERGAVTRELGGGDPKEVMKELGRRWGIAKAAAAAAVGGGKKEEEVEVEVEVIDLTQQLEGLGL